MAPWDPVGLLPNDALGSFIVRQRWFGGKARGAVSASVVDWVALTPAAGVAIVAVHYPGSSGDRYVVPLASVSADDGARIMKDVPRAVVCRLPDGCLVIDGMFDDALCHALLDSLTTGVEVVARRGRFRGGALAEAPAPGGPLPIQRSAPDQSNTSVVFGSRFILKIFRRVEPGPNPDVELGAFLSAHGFPHVPQAIGAAEYAEEGGEATSVAILQRFIVNRGNGWQVALKGLTESLLRGESAYDDSLQLPVLLGRRTGEMHLALAAGREPHLVPEPYTRTDLAALARGMRTRAEVQFDLLAASVSNLAPVALEPARQVLGARERLLAAFRDIAALEDAGCRTRCHGDYHLGQTLVTDDDVVILDFEGEPARTLAERRAKSSPIRDVAGMQRSFSYLAEAAVRAAREDAPDTTAAITTQAHQWQAAAEAAFMDAYLAALGSSPIIPRDRRAIEVLRRAFLIDKAAYELGYELNNRPDWLPIPLAGLLRLAESSPPPCEDLE